MAGRKSFLDHFRLIDDDDDEYEDDDDYVFEDEEEEEYEEPFRKKKPLPEKKAPRPVKPAPKPAYQAPPARETRRPAPATSTATDKLVSFDGGMKPRAPRSAASNEVYVIKPQEFDDAQTVTDFLKRGRAIVINMEGLQLEPAQRIIDFIGGACYGIGGELKAISANIFIAVPSSIEVSGDLRDEILSSTGMSPHLS